MPRASDDNLTGKQTAVITALLGSATIAKAAESAGVGERTIYKWLKIPTFKAAYREAQRESFKHSIAITQKYLPHAVQTLVKVMADEAAPHNAKVSAATALMKYARESIELDDVVERVERLEANVAEREQPPQPQPQRWGSAA
jgi:transposase-like protein